MKTQAGLITLSRYFVREVACNSFWAICIILNILPMPSSLPINGAYRRCELLINHKENRYGSRSLTNNASGERRFSPGGYKCHAQQRPVTSAGMRVTRVTTSWVRWPALKLTRCTVRLSTSLSISRTLKYCCAYGTDSIGQTYTIRGCQKASINNHMPASVFLIGWYSEIQVTILPHICIW